MPTVSLKENNQIKEFAIEDKETIYEALERQGTELPHGCLAGSCGACKIEIIEGADNLSPPSVVEKDTLDHLHQHIAQKKGEDFLKGKTIRLSCRTKVTASVCIEPLKL